MLDHRECPLKTFGSNACDDTWFDSPMRKHSSDHVIRIIQGLLRQVQVAIGHSGLSHGIMLVGGKSQRAVAQCFNLMQVAVNYCENTTESERFVAL